MIAVESIAVEHAVERDIATISALNNLFAPDGLTLPRSEDFVTAHLADYQVVRDTMAPYWAASRSTSIRRHWWNWCRSRYHRRRRDAASAAD